MLTLLFLLLFGGADHLEIYTSQNCPPCRRLRADIEEDPEMLGALSVRFLPASAGREKGVRVVPTLILYEDGKEVDRVSGYAGKAALKRWLED